MPNEIEPQTIWDVFKWLVGGAMLVLSGIVSWVIGDKLKENSEDHEQLRKDHSGLDSRLRFLEANIVKKGDVDYLAQRLDQIQRDNTTQNNSIMQAIMNRK